MAGKYYSATPIGAGMQNLATAISGIPDRQAQAGLLAAREEETRNQILLHNAQREKAEEEARGIRRKNDARQSWADQVRRGATTGEAGPPADDVAPTPENDTSMPSVASALVPSAMPGPSTIDPSPLPAMPARGGVAGSVLPSLPPITVQGQRPTPSAASRTGLTPQFNRDFNANAILAEEDNVANYLRSLVGGNLAATEPDPDKAFSYVQGGAGQGFDSTFTGGQAKQEQTVKRDEAASKDRRYATDQRTATSVRGQNMTDARVRSGAGRGAKKGASTDLKRADLTFIDKKIDEFAVAKGKGLGPDAKVAMRQRVQDLYDDGESLEDAIDIANSEAYETTPEHDEPGRFYGTNKVPEKTEFKKPTPRERVAGGGAAAPAGAPAAAKPKAVPPAPKAGTVEGGYKFKGGNPADPKNWAKV